MDLKSYLYSKKITLLESNDFLKGKNFELYSLVQEAIFSNNLNDINLIKYSYNKAINRLYLPHNEKNELIKGKWFEHYTASIVFKIINKLYTYYEELDFEILLNVLIESKSHKLYELDVVLRLEQFVYLIECKSGFFDYNEIKRYHQLIYSHQLPIENFFCVVFNIQTNYAEILSERIHVQFIDIKLFEKNIYYRFFEDLYTISSMMKLKLKN